MASGRQQGFTLFELITAVLAISIAGAMLLDRLFYYQELAEKAEMEYTISAVKSALRLRMAEMLVAGRAQDYGLLAADNPMNWLEQKPRNYLGTLAENENADLKQGSWYFDARSRELIYTVNRGDHLQVEHSIGKQIRWRVVEIKTAVPAEGRSSIIHGANSVAIKLITPYRWF